MLLFSAEEESGDGESLLGFAASEESLLPESPPLVLWLLVDEGSEEEEPPLLLSGFCGSDGEPPSLDVPLPELPGWEFLPFSDDLEDCFSWPD